MNNASTYAVSAKVKKSGKITFHAAKLVCAIMLGKFGLNISRNKSGCYKQVWRNNKPDSVNPHLKLTTLCPVIAATAYLYYDGCAGIYKELKTWNESNEIKARFKK